MNTRARMTIWALALALLLGAPEAVGAEEVDLPAPSTDGSTSVEETIEGRSSARRFSDAPLSKSEIAQLLWAAGGETADGVSGPTRAPASAGGIYPVEPYLVVGDARELAPGVYRYDWRGHGLERIAGGDRRRRLSRAALGQGAVSRAPCIIVLAADYAATARRYGERGTERYVHMDAGHAAQNVLLQAEALDLGAVPIGAFSDTSVRRVLEIELDPLYLIPVGHRR